MTKSSVLLKDQAYEKIKEGILTGYFKPGNFLSETKLIDFLEMSKTPIKSALAVLETEGFVTVSANQGIMINELTIKKMIDIYDLRTALEMYNCDKVETEITENQLIRLKENLHETQRCIDKEDVIEFTKKDHEFHLLLCEYANNKEIHQILLNYQDKLNYITLQHLSKNPSRMKKFLKEHYEIFDSIKQNDKNSAKLMKNHLQSSKNLLLN